MAAFLDLMIYGNTVRSWGLALALSLLLYLAIGIGKRSVVKKLEKVAQLTSTRLDDLLLVLIRRTRSGIVLVVSMFLGLQLLTLPEPLMSLFTKIALLVFLVQIGIWGSFLISDWLENYVAGKAENRERVTTVRTIGFLVRLLFFSLIVLWGLDNLGVNITALIAGLGVGGVAVALAVQNILGDLFASLTIVFDKPFVIGDFILVGEHLGTIEHIGLKTTRVRSISGEQLIFSNTDLLQSRIRNFKRMLERRVVFTFGVVYQTPYEKLKVIPGMVKAIIEAQQKVRFDRAHFFKYGDSSLDFEVVYWVLDPDYNFYMDTRQAINLEICRRFVVECIEFAYPTRTVYMTPQGLDSRGSQSV